MELIGHAKLSLFQDSWICVIGADGEYAVKDGYCFLRKTFLPELELSEDVGRIVKKNWASLAPLKVIIFPWQLLFQRLPTRANLFKRGVFRSPSQTHYVWCHFEMESEVHLFTKCSVAVEVWAAIYSWLGLYTAVLGNLYQAFETFGFPFKCKKRTMGLNLIWQTVMWSLWIVRNSIIFEGKTPKAYEIVEAIKHKSLEWFIARKYVGVCLSYEWEKFPLFCQLR
jgi:hypothetical protein